MNNNHPRFVPVLAALAGLAFSATVSAQLTAYDNTLTPANNFFSLGAGVNGEFGDRIKLGVPDGINVVQMTDFSFEYYTDNLTPDAAKKAILTIRAVDGAFEARNSPKQSPGSVVFTSTSIGTIDLQGTPGAGKFKKVDIHLNTPMDVPTTFDWAVEFKGLGVGESAGLPVYGPPTVGLSGDDFWIKDTQGWSVNLIDSGNIPANFGARVTIVPEPSTLALAILGGFGLLGYFARRRS